MMRKILFAALLSLPAVAMADHPSAPREYRQEVRETRDDWRDEARLQVLLSDLDRVRRYRMFRQMPEIDGRLERLLREESNETRREMVDARRDARDPWAPGYERRDDRRDYVVERRVLKTLHDLRVRAARVKGQVNAFAMKERRDIVVRLIDLARAERHEDRRELHDGHAEAFPNRR